MMWFTIVNNIFHGNESNIMKQKTNFTESMAKPENPIHYIRIKIIGIQILLSETKQEEKVKNLYDFVLFSLEHNTIIIKHVHIVRYSKRRDVYGNQLTIYLPNECMVK